MKQQAKNPFGRNGKPVDGGIAQNITSNKVEYKWHLVCYSSTLDYCLRKLVEHCLVNIEEINTIKELQNKISKLYEKINTISADNERFIEQNILSSSADQEVDAERIAEEAINCS